MENVEDSRESSQFQTLSMEALCRRQNSVWNKLKWCYEDTIRPYLTRRFFAIIISGQFLSLVLCMIGVAGQKLVVACGVQIPAFQTFCNYMLLSMVFTTKFVTNTENAKIVVKTRWWKYIIIAAIDVYANFFMFTAYQYTSLTSVQLLDCLTVPCLVILSIIVLKAKYKAVHFIGVLICLGGVGLMVWADFTSRSQGPQPGNRHSELLGDLLAIAGACSYAFSNIAEEFVVKTSTITEFLGMMSFFACFVSGANVIIFERNHLSIVVWNFETILYLSLSVLSQFAFYVILLLLVQNSSATLVTLMLLTADIYSLLAGIYLFNYTFSAFYILSFAIIVLGVVIFKIFPTPSRVDRYEERETEINNSSSSRGSQDSLTQPLI